MLPENIKGHSNSLYGNQILFSKLLFLHSPQKLLYASFSRKRLSSWPAIAAFLLDLVFPGLNSLPPTDSFRAQLSLESEKG